MGETAAVIRRYVDEVLNGPAPAAACRDLLTLDFRFEGPGNAAGLDGPDAFAAFQDVMRGALADLHFELERAIVDGSDAALVLRMTGRHLGSFAGVEPTGASVDLRLVDILRLRGGRIAAVTAYLDSAELRRQLSG